LDKVIGLGKLGCAIAEELTAYPEYRVYKIDASIGDRASLALGHCITMDQYESNLDQEEVAIYLRAIKSQDSVLLIAEGGDPILGAALGILQTVKNATINLLYICPEREMLTDTQKRDDKISFNVLQEYARSGMFDKIYLVSAPLIERLMGEVAIQKYEKQFSYFVSYAVAMLNFFHHSPPIISSDGEVPIGCRVATIGAPLLENENPPLNLFFPLEQISGIHFYYGVPQEEIEDDTALLTRIKSHVRFYKSSSLATSFSVYATTLSDKISFCVAYSPAIQPLVT
jgi:hypothetical protein